MQSGTNSSQTPETVSPSPLPNHKNNNNDSTIQIKTLKRKTRNDAIKIKMNLNSNRWQNQSGWQSAFVHAFLNAVRSSFAFKFDTRISHWWARFSESFIHLSIHQYQQQIAQEATFLHQFYYYLFVLLVKFRVFFFIQFCSSTPREPSVERQKPYETFPQRRMELPQNFATQNKWQKKW